MSTADWAPEEGTSHQMHRFYRDYRDLPRSLLRALCNREIRTWAHENGRDIRTMLRSQDEIEPGLRHLYSFCPECERKGEG